MANETNGNQFREDEILVLDQVRDGKWVKNIFPKIGGRLRLAHKENDQLSITTEIIKYDENLAVVRAITTTMKGNFPGLGMSSLDRDHSIAPAILELAETRSIAKSLRFAGYGVEYCSAEEISPGSIKAYLKKSATIANKTNIQKVGFVIIQDSHVKPPERQIGIVRRSVQVA